MEYALASIFSQLLGSLSLKGDIEINFVSTVQFLFQTIANLLRRLVQIPQPCDCQHVYLSCNGESRGREEPSSGRIPCDCQHVYLACNGESRGREETSSGRIMSVSEVSVVMNRLGMENVSVGGAEGKMGVGPEVFESLFEEEEPSLEEIRMAFGVFDLNKDGYIDALELQRVVRELGLKENTNDQGLEECRRMMRAFDSNGDGLIDFADFVKLMEKCLC